MRKLFSIIAATFVATTMFAATAPKATFDFKNQSWNFPTTATTDVTTFTNGDQSIVVSAGFKGMTTSSSDPTIKGVLFGKKNATITLPAFSFRTEKILVYYVDAAGSGNTKHNIFVGETAVSTEVTGCKVVGDANHSTFEIAESKRAANTVYVLKVTSDHNMQVSKIEVYEDESAPAAVYAPTFEPAAETFEGAVTITLACATEGASIFFTLDGSEPATEAGGATQAYSAPFTITKTATVKAIAVKGTDKSTVAEKTYTKLVVNQYEVAEAIAAAGASPAEIKKDDLIKVRGVVTKMTAKGKNFKDYGSLTIYVKDATGATGEFQFFNCLALDNVKFSATTPAYDPTGTTVVEFTSATDVNGVKLSLGDTVVAKGKFELYNNTTYELQQNCFLTSIVEGEGPAPVEIDIQSGVMFSAGVEEDQHFWQIQAENDDYYVTLAYVGTSTSVAGTYTEADLAATYSYIYDYNADAKIEMASANLVVTVNATGTEADLAGTFVGTDGSKFNLKLHYTEPKPETTVNVNIEEATLEVDTEEGLYGVMGEDATGLWVQLFIYTDEFEGEYDESDLNYESSVWFDDENYVDIYTAEIEVVPADNIDNGYRVTADLLCYNNTLYKVTMTVPGDEPSAINNVENVKSNVMKAIENGHLFINVNGVRYNVNGAIVK